MRKLLFDTFKNFQALLVEVPGRTFLGELGKRDDNVRVSVDEPLVEITETKEGLYILHLSRFWPFKDSLDLIFSHLEAVCGQNESEILHRILVKFAFLGGGI